MTISFKEVKTNRTEQNRMADAEANKQSKIYDFPGKTRSSVWRFFGFRKKSDGPPIKNNLEMSTVICKLCLKSYANKGNTTNLQQHLDKHHRSDETGPSKPAPPKFLQPRIYAPLPKRKIGTERKQNLDDLTLKLIVGKVLPMSLVSNRHFKDLVKELDPSYKLPTKHEIERSRLHKELSMVEKVKKDLPSKNGFVAITHDGWTSCATQSYDTITVHFINKEWELRSAVLQTQKVEGSHTSENIASRLKEAVAYWNLPTPIVVTDNAANEVKAVQLLGWERFGCYGHRINLVVKHSLQVPEVQRIVAKARKLVGVFHTSTSVNDCLMEKQQTVFQDNPTIIGHKLIQDVQTRWNSTYDMLSRVVEQTAAIFAVASDDRLSKTASNSVRTYCLTFDEQSTVEGLLQLLLPFKMATTILCSQNAPTMSKVLLCMTKINQALSKSYSPILMKVVEAMKEQLQKRTELEDISVMGSMLNPDLKSGEFLTDDLKQSAHKLLLEKAIDLGNSLGNAAVKTEKEETSTTEIPSSSGLPTLPSLPTFEPEIESSTSESKDGIDLNCSQPVAKKIKCSDMEEWFDDVIITGQSITPVTNLIEQEVARYLATPRKTDDANLSLLEWWRKHEDVYPRLSLLAKKYLAVPASSVPSERVFSLAGNLVNKKRSRLTPDKVNSLIFLKMNMDLYW